MRTATFFCTAAALLLTSAAAAQAPTPAPAGLWQGNLQAAPGSELVVFFDLKGQSSALSGTLSVPQQTDQLLPLSSVVLRHDSLLLGAERLHARFAGRFSADGQQVAGTWFQGGAQLPLTLRRSTAKDKAAATPRRPQVPQAPFPYRSEDLTFPNQPAGFDLAGTLTLPAGKGPFPAVVLVSGSGPEDRNETILGHQPFLVLADYLTRRGFAVLRYDDRGIGQSKGTFKNATTADFTTDAQAALAYLRTRPDIRPHQVALIGHSEGGIIGGLAAAQPGGPDLLVSLAGPGLPGAAVLLRQQADLARAAGADSASIGRNYRLHRALFAELHRQPPTLPTDQLTAKLVATVQQQPDAGTEQARLALAKTYAAPWMHAFLRIDPATYLAKVHCPVLALNGANDLQVAADQNLPAIERGLRAAHNPDVTIKTLPQLNHFFQTDPAATSRYASIEETFAPSALQVIGDWLSARTSGKGAAGK
ncbi:alpha/beta hydrolase family protein [Hymenobacter cellulosivorans]|uniref:Alpha/beta fold hydrolase n=1 Tax=Hymenobacter cellulosivorans TaxID=2932249 RepID=A0ABY4FC64_9BACT|nr:alpha/beta fold hydrolase [Hymenobacter cellulosivorans]UOQ53582.1 alpha/beta fold hydrolase [Hymenobacter cellulosivorans]